ncbi:MAG: circadian clock protein KaiC [Actinomycetes bacterium]
MSEQDGDGELRTGSAVRNARAADAMVHGTADVFGKGSLLSVPKVETGIPGFDHVTMGGLPRRRATVLAGQAGSAKTVFAAQFLAEGVQRGQPGVFVTLEEPADDLRANFTTLGWAVEEWEKAGDWAFVDASPLMRDDGTVHDFGLSVLSAQIGHAVDRTGAERVVVDSLNSVLSLDDQGVARQHLRALIADLRGMGLTTILTVETQGDPGTTLSRHGIEEFVADSVVLLRNIREEKARRRTVEVLKMRGSMHRKGDYPFTVLPGMGVVVLPMSGVLLSSGSSDVRVSSGNPGVDELCHGGFFRDSITLVSGATGTGKTLLATEFLAGGASAGERVLLLAYEESPDQIFRNAAGWGHDFERYERDGLLKVVALYPEVASLDDHLVEIREVIDGFRPTRVAIDSLSALERVSSGAGYREFIIGLTSYVKQERVTTLLTAATPTLLGGTSITEGHISTLTDAIILLRYVEMFGSVNRGLTVLKMRGSSHDHEIRQYTIDGSGMHIGQPFRSVGGILSGRVVNHGNLPSAFDDVLPPPV